MSASESGVLYQYYWIKVATKEQVEEYRSLMLSLGLPAAAAEPHSGGVVPPPKQRPMAADPNSGGVVPPPKLMPLVHEVHGGGVVPPPKKVAGASPSGGGVVPPPKSPSGATLNVDLGFILSADHANRSNLLIDMRAMPPDFARQDAEEWMRHDPEARVWAGNAFCVLAYVALAPT